MLAEAILARGMNIESLADASGLSANIVLLIMEGRLHPVPEIRRRLAAALGIDPGLIGDR